jgi:hypothetical protein
VDLTKKPKPNTLWRHFKGTVYIVVPNPMSSDDGRPLMEERVFYRRFGDTSRETWGRPFEEWDNVLPGGIRRFTFVDDYKGQ